MSLEISDKTVQNVEQMMADSYTVLIYTFDKTFIKVLPVNREFVYSLSFYLRKTFGREVQNEIALLKVKNPKH